MQEMGDMSADPWRPTASWTRPSPRMLCRATHSSCLTTCEETTRGRATATVASTLESCLPWCDTERQQPVPVSSPERLYQHQATLLASAGKQCWFVGVFTAVGATFKNWIWAMPAIHYRVPSTAVSCLSILLTREIQEKFLRSTRCTLSDFFTFRFHYSW